MLKAQCFAGKVHHDRVDKKATLKQLTEPWQLGLVYATKSAVACRRKNAVLLCAAGYTGISQVVSLRRCRIPGMYISCHVTAAAAAAIGLAPTPPLCFSARRRRRRRRRRPPLTAHRSRAPPHAANPPSISFLPRPPSSFPLCAGLDSGPYHGAKLPAGDGNRLTDFTLPEDCSNLVELMVPALTMNLP